MKLKIRGEVWEHTDVLPMKPVKLLAAQISFRGRPAVGRDLTTLPVLYLTQVNLYKDRLVLLKRR